MITQTLNLKPEDKISIFAIRSTDNKLLVQNMPLEYAELTGRVLLIEYYRIRLMWLILLTMRKLGHSERRQSGEPAEQIKRHFCKSWKWLR